MFGFLYENRSIFRELIGPILTLMLVFVIGTVGYYYMSGENASVIDSFYMTFITITTIGFEEVIDLSNHQWGRVFTIFISLAGIGVLTYLVTHITAIIVEGKLGYNFRRMVMERELSELKNHFIICGFGRSGSNINRDMRNQGFETVVIDSNDERFKEMLEAYPEQLMVEGDATEDQLLERAGVKRAAGLFITTHDDNTALMICLTARNLNADLKIITSCQHPENIRKMYIAGADNVVAPSHIGAHRMVNEMVKPHVTSFLDSMMIQYNKNLNIEQLRVSEKMDRYHINDLNLKDLPHTIILAVHKESEWIFNPARSLELRENDMLITLTSELEFQKLKTMV